MGWALIRGWAFINFFCLKDGRLFEVGANSRLGAYSNKNGNISGSRGVPNANLFNFTSLLADFGKVLCSSANELKS